MKKEYEVIGKNYDDDWETIASEIKTKTEAVKIAKKQKESEWKAIDINLIIDNDLKETYNKFGKII